MLVPEPIANVVTGQFPGIGLIELVTSCISIPGGFGRHRTLLLPIAAPVWCLAHAQDEIHRKHGFPVVAEGPHQLRAFDLPVGNPADRGARFVGQAFSQVYEDVAGPGGEGVPLDGGSGRGGHFCQNACGKPVGIVARTGFLLFILRTIRVIVDFQRPGRGHGQERPQFRAADPGQVHVGIAREVAVLRHIRRGPPAAVLVPGVETGAHHVEGAHAHQPVRRHGTGIARAEVGRADERVHISGLGSERQGQERCAHEGQDLAHGMNSYDVSKIRKSPGITKQEAL